MLEKNKHFQKLPQYIPTGIEYSRRLFTLLIRQHPSLERITEQFIDGRWFDIALHLRGTIAVKNLEWDLRPGMTRTTETIQEIMQADPKRTTPIRILIAATYSNMTAICRELTFNCTRDYPATKCVCEYFDPFVHEAKYGLAPDIRSSENPGGFDWGLYPPWVTYIHTFMHAYTCV